MLFYAAHPRRVLEFGAGGSTVRWSAKSALWMTIEHHPEWAQAVREQTSALVCKVGGRSADDYLAAVVGEFDLIFVDGLYRVECVQQSPKWLAYGGIVVLHDASRVEYRAAWDTYPHIVHLTKGNGKANGLAVMWQ